MAGRALGLLLVLAVGVAAGFALSRYAPWTMIGDEPMAMGDAGGEATAGMEGEAGILYWVSPMDPNFRSDKPGKSPMGMDLIPAYADNAAKGAEGSIRIDPSVINNIGVRTAVAEVGALDVPIDTVGRITFDEERLAQIHLRSSGWIERLAVRAVGEPVNKGDLLFEVYSPELVAAQAEYLQALRLGRAPLVKASRDRLRALGISEGQIGAVEKTGVTQQYVRVYAPISGVVTALNAADGKYVMPDTPVMILADLSRVWLVSAVFEADAERLLPGAVLEAHSTFDLGTVLSGTVDYVYPDLDMVTRTVSARTILDNSDGALKPGMYMTVHISGRRRPETILVPREALIRTGRDERVILALGDGRFQPAKVVSGMEAEGKVEILSGLQPGERVVVSSQFLIDSESSFAGATLRLQPSGDGAAMPQGGTADTPGMPGMKMDGATMPQPAPAAMGDAAMDGMAETGSPGAGKRPAQ